MNHSVPVHVKRTVVEGDLLQTVYRVLMRHCRPRGRDDVATVYTNEDIITRFADAGLDTRCPYTIETDFQERHITAVQDDSLLQFERIRFLDSVYASHPNLLTIRTFCFDNKTHYVSKSEFPGWLAHRWGPLRPDQARRDGPTMSAADLANYGGDQPEELDRLEAEIKEVLAREEGLSTQELVLPRAGSPSQEGVKFDQGKRRYSLIPTAFLQDMADIMTEDPTLPLHLISKEFIRDIARVLKHGAEKYVARNWEKGMAWSRPYDASKRHLIDGFWAGEDRDPETGILHTAHAACNDMFLHAFQLRCIGTDDRPKEDSQ